MQKYKGLLKIASFSLVIVLLKSLSGCSLLYVAKQGLYQTKLIMGARSIEDILRYEKIPSNERKKLMLISEVRSFAHKNLLLKADNYKNANLDFNQVIYNVTGSKPLEFKPYTWWFPIIGSVPYKGFFSLDDALSEEKRLKGLGYETLIRKVSGYSTLGYFSDPVWRSMLKRSDESLVELIIHELVHATIYIKNNSSFNESLANFIGKEGAKLFFAKKFGAGSQEYLNLLKYQKNQIIRQKFFVRFYKKLNKIYKSALPKKEKVKVKEQIIKTSLKEYKTLPLPPYWKRLNEQNINNAYLLSYRRYNNNNKLFKEIYSISDRKFDRFMHIIKKVESSEKPYQEMNNLAARLKRENER